MWHKSCKQIVPSFGIPYAKPVGVAGVPLVFVTQLEAVRLAYDVNLTRNGLQLHSEEIVLGSIPVLGARKAQRILVVFSCPCCLC